MLTLEEKAYKMWENKAVNECPFFCVIGLDEEATACFRGAVKVDYATGAVEPLETYAGEGGEAFRGLLNDLEEERLKRGIDRPEAWVRVPPLQGEEGLKIRWILSRTGNLRIQEHTAVEVPLFFYNMGRKRCKAYYDIHNMDLDLEAEAFTIPPAAVRMEREDMLKRIREPERWTDFILILQ